MPEGNNTLFSLSEKGSSQVQEQKLDIVKVDDNQEVLWSLNTICHQLEVADSEDILVRVEAATSGIDDSCANSCQRNSSSTECYFTKQFLVAIDGCPVDSKGVGRKVIDKVQETYDCELNGKDFAYDGEKTLFMIGSLAQNKLEFQVVLEDVTSNRNNEICSPDGHRSPNESDMKRMRCPYRAKTFKVEISFAAKIPM